MSLYLKGKQLSESTGSITHNGISEISEVYHNKIDKIWEKISSLPFVWINNGNVVSPYPFKWEVISLSPNDYSVNNLQLNKPVMYVTAPQTSNVSVNMRTNAIETKGNKKLTITLYYGERGEGIGSPIVVGDKTGRLSLKSLKEKQEIDISGNSTIYFQSLYVVYAWGAGSIGISYASFS